MLTIYYIERIFLPKLSVDQHEFFSGRSTNSLDYSCYIHDAFDDRIQVDTIFIDFC
jgi:hypothetical protein